MAGSGIVRPNVKGVEAGDAGKRPRAVPPKHGVRNLTAAERIATRLEEEIVLGRRHPRERLIEQELCDQFGTHRADVRLAFFELEKKGIIQRIPNRGAIVRDLTPDEVLAIYAVREELEVMAVRTMPLPIGRAQVGQLESIQGDHASAIEAGNMLSVFYANLRFHRALYMLCGNPCLIETIEQLAQKVYGIRSYANADAGALGRARDDHDRMLAALRASNRKELIVLTRRHLEPSPQAYIRAYRSRFSDIGAASQLPEASPARAKRKAAL